MLAYGSTTVRRGSPASRTRPSSRAAIGSTPAGRIATSSPSGRPARTPYAAGGVPSASPAGLDLDQPVPPEDEVVEPAARRAARSAVLVNVRAQYVPASSSTDGRGPG